MRNNVLIRYFLESFQELRRVTWPTKNQAIRMTVLVLVFSLASAIIIGILDYVFGLGYTTLLDLFSKQ